MNRLSLKIIIKYFCTIFKEYISKLMQCIFFLLFVTSCSRTQIFNAQTYKFGKYVENIVWLQVAGLSEEHLAVIRFIKKDSDKFTSIENSECIGKVWNYNLYDIRPSAYNGFLSQITGSDNIKGTCQDYKNNAIWKRLYDRGVISGIFETNSKISTIKNLNKCPNNDFLNKTIFWKMAKPPAKNLKFHYQDNVKFNLNKVYYDQSCQDNGCYSSLFENAKYAFDYMRNNNQSYMFLFRDFSYYEALKSKNVLNARGILNDIEKLFSYIASKIDKKKTLLVLTSTSAQRFEFPKKGKEWKSFENKGNFIIFRNTSLMSPVFSLGVKSENFCNIFKEYQIFNRILN